MDCMEALNFFRIHLNELSRPLNFCRGQKADFIVLSPRGAIYVYGLSKKSSTNFFHQI